LDAHLALLRDAEGTARQAWSRYPDAEGWRAAGKVVAEDAAGVQARMARRRGGGGGEAAPLVLLRRMLLLEEEDDDDNDSNESSKRLRRSLMEQLDFRIASALAAEAEAEAAKEKRDDEPRRRRLRRRVEQEEDEGQGGMWRAALLEMERQRERQLQADQDPAARRSRLLRDLHAAQQAEAAATTAVAAAAAGELGGSGGISGRPEVVELDDPRMARAAAAVPGLEPYLSGGSHSPPVALALSRAAVRRLLLLRDDDGEAAAADEAAAAALRRLAYERGLRPAVEAAALALPEVWRWRAEAARCVTALLMAPPEGGGGVAAPPAPPPDAARRLFSDPDAALEFLFDLLDAIRPAADVDASPAALKASSSPWDVEGLLQRGSRAGEQEDDGEDAAASSPGLASHLRLGGVLRGLASASAELFGLEIAELPAGSHPDRPPDLPDRCLAFSVSGGRPADSSAGVLALDPCPPGQGYGTRVVRLRFPVASASEGPEALVPSPSHALVAIGLGLEAGGVGGGRGGDESNGGGPLPVDDPSWVLPSSWQVFPPQDDKVEDEQLSFSALWELAHEFGHALHLLLSNAAAAAAAESAAPASSSSASFAGTPLEGAGTHHLAGRFLPSDALEVPSQLFERLMLEPAFLSRVCLATAAADGSEGSTRLVPLPPSDARRLAQRLRRDYASPLPVQDRALAAVAEQLCVLSAFYGVGSEEEASQAWASARLSGSSLDGGGGGGGGEDKENSEPQAFTATLRQAAMLPVVARHRGTYYSYSLGWAAAAALGERVLRPLVRATFEAEEEEDSSGGRAEAEALRRRARSALCAHAGMAPADLAEALGLSSARAMLEADAGASPAWWWWR
jgi:hypothetical protein